MKGSHVTKKIKGIMYVWWGNNDEFYANRTADIIREAGWRAEVLPSNKKGEFEVWKSVNKVPGTPPSEWDRFYGG